MPPDTSAAAAAAAAAIADASGAGAPLRRPQHEPAHSWCEACWLSFFSSVACALLLSRHLTLLLTLPARTDDG